MKPTNGHAPPPLHAQTFYCAKDLAQRLKVEPRTVRRWALKFKVGATINRTTTLRWSETDAERLIAAVAGRNGAAARRSFSASAGLTRGRDQ
jgi:predicted site-specific integrase-resolvase